MSQPRQLWLLVGGDGAGTSTFYRLSLQPLGVPFVNADVLARVAYPDSPEAHSYDAAKLAEEQRHNLLLRGVSFCFETVYSHPSKVDFVGRAKALGYQVIMVMIHLDSPALNQARISQGDFDVPADKVVSRILRLLQHVRTTLPLCDIARVYDNSSADHPFTPIFTVRHGRIERDVDSLPDWAEGLLAGF